MSPNQNRNKNKEAFARLSVLVVIGVAALFSQGGAGGAGRADAKMPMVRLGKDNIVKVEVATTEAEIQRGLMFRTSLAQDSGMIFLFRPNRPVKFWMFNCLISLDMLFVKDGKIVKICENVPPCKSKIPDECPTYPDAPIDVTEVVEVSAGYAKAHGLKEGDTVSFDIP
ncbi:MAG: DUF192 domain-containing protein [Candidatus Melainabacteria bacterium]|nr:MAG: DUF192 domain-containing protein [Candidatus Melainabacteria bacterium]